MVRLIPAFLLSLAYSNIIMAGDLYREIGASYSIDPDLLRAVAQQESQMNPYALNINGEPCMKTNYGFVIDGKEVFCDSIVNSVRVVRAALSNPYILSVTSPKGHKYRFWVRDDNEGRTFAKRNHLTIEVLKRKNTRNIDFGLMQINWPAHGQKIGDASKLLDAHYNLSYAAQHLSSLYSKLGAAEAIGAYHAGANGSKRRKASYREKVLEKYLAFKD
jgi:hypothetical protein